MIDSTIAPLTYFHLSVGHDKLSAALGGCTKMEQFSMVYGSDKGLIVISLGKKQV